MQMRKLKNHIVSLLRSKRMAAGTKVLKLGIHESPLKCHSPLLKWWLHYLVALGPFSVSLGFCFLIKEFKIHPKL